MDKRTFSPTFATLGAILLVWSSQLTSAAFTHIAISDATCRHKHEAYSQEPDSCKHDTCFLSKAAYHVPAFQTPVQQRQLCNPRIPRTSYDAAVAVPLEFVDDSPQNCTKSNLIQKGFKFLKLSQNGSSRDVFSGVDNRYTCETAKTSEFWCSNSELSTRADPLGNRCAATIEGDTVANMYGTWQAVMPGADGLVQSVTTQNFLIEPVDSPCEVCFRSPGECTTLSKDQLKTGGNGLFFYEVTVVFAKRQCFVVADSFLKDRDSYWSFISASNVPDNAVLQYTRAHRPMNPPGQWMMTGFDLQPGASAHGEYRQCVYIPRMTEALSGTYVYQHYQSPDSTTKEIIVVRVQPAAVATPQSFGDTARYNTTITAVYAWLALLTCACLVVAYVIKKRRRDGAFNGHRRRSYRSCDSPESSSRPSSATSSSDSLHASTTE